MMFTIDSDFSENHHIHARARHELPPLIQGGMGVRISGWKLANATARAGALGVVSTTGLRHIVIEEIRAGDEDAIAIARSFPIERYAQDILSFAPGGPCHEKPQPMDFSDPRRCGLPRRLSAIAAYIEVVRAKSGHRGMVGANVMWKCALTALPSIYGAMLAGVDALLCGAGVPMELPDIVRKMRAGEDLTYEPLHGTETNARFSIASDCAEAHLCEIAPPRLIPILSNYAFPKRVLDIWNRQFNGIRPDAFVLENHKAGGHNAYPRNKETFAQADDVENYFERVLELGVPVYVAGGGTTREDFLRWQSLGAYGVQAGSRFALCRESGMRDDLRNAIIAGNARGETEILTDKRLSSTGFPFKYVRLPGLLPQEDVYQARRRICNLGFLRQSHMRTKLDGTQVEEYICPAMPERQYVRLGGDIADTVGRVCLCNALLATAGMRWEETAIVTLGHAGSTITRLQSAREVIEEIMTPEWVDERSCALSLEAGNG